MNQREFGRTAWRVGEIGLGCWQFGGDFGPLDEDRVFEILENAVHSGVNFLDTADVYGAGLSESLIGRFLKEHSGDLVVATKLGRGADLFPDRYTREGLRAATEASLQRLGVERIDLTQLHCIPTACLREGRVFEWLRELQAEGKIEHFGASVESIDEALLCLEQPGLASMQIIFNIFRQKPIERLFEQARRKKVALIIRLPLASGLLSGKFDAATRFDESDHRHYNRDGQAFNVGETFAGIPFEKAIELAQSLAPLVPPEMSMAQMALRWILDHDAVSVVIPGATSAEQVRANVAASKLPPLDKNIHERFAEIYRSSVRELIRGPY